MKTPDGKMSVKLLKKDIIVMYWALHRNYRIHIFNNLDQLATPDYYNITNFIHNLAKMSINKPWQEKQLYTFDVNQYLVVKQLYEKITDLNDLEKVVFYEFFIDAEKEYQRLVTYKSAKTELRNDNLLT